MIGAVIVATALLVSKDNPKVLVAVRGKTYTESLVDSYLSAGVDKIIVVTGEHDSILRKALKSLPVICVKDPDYQEHNMLESARVGLRQLSGICDRVYISPVQTAVTDKQTLLEMKSKSADVVLPLLQGAEDNPLLFSSKLIQWSLLYNGKRGIKGVWESLVKTGGATLCHIKVNNHKREPIYNDNQMHYKPVINWI